MKKSITVIPEECKGKKKLVIKKKSDMKKKEGGLEKNDMVKDLTLKNIVSKKKEQSKQ